ncbi:glycosyltransferase family 39 protein [cf. Phormidesmis sp. LEGE 11477]|uniref:glycosyltransferase family 39 protein n=1 Tax=cf. Phormidesmis sp. LEGE 11477 TaxID=1828680 RepID=UPI00188166A0|nr:glycosyltransferase family 39 protein [cf. Phormidesmis sp. LEGE 11477]MBE9062638.1 glycosyltransferase family 39 protein [cf. Phormidesmis sp. LEGE 11477]
MKIIGCHTKAQKERVVKRSELKKLALELLLLTLLTLLCRVPFFFKSVINWDESTFILIGQSLLDGHLPYTQLWDLKPPFLFGFFSLAILLFGKTIASIRFAGALVVALTAFGVNRITQRLWTVRAGWIAAVLFVLMMSVMTGGQPVMSEHPAILLLTLALWLLVAQGVTTAALFYSGLLISAATMMRLNLVYVAIGVGLYLLASGLLMPTGHRQPLGQQVRNLCAYSLGCIIPVFSGFIPYWMASIPQVWWTSVVVSSFYRANVGLEGYEVAVAFSHRILVYLWSWHGFGLQILFWLGAIAGVRLVLKRRTQLQPQQKFGWALVITFIFTIQFSILGSGSDHSHYLIQLVPFLAIFSGSFVEQVIKQSRRVFAVVVLLLCLGTYPVLSQYATITHSWLIGAPIDPSPARAIANYLLAQGLEDRSIYMMDQHIAYWYLGTYPLIRSTAHPSTIGKDYLLQILYGPDWSSPREMKRLLDLEPDIIVQQDDPFYFRDQPKTVEILETALDQDYTFIHEVKGTKIYVQKGLQAAENKP